MTAIRCGATFDVSALEPSFVEKWRTALAAGDADAAWSEFIERYRRLIFAVIRRTASNPDDADEIFADICGELATDNMARLAQHDDSGPARFSTWLVTVVQHLSIDWLRHRDGRQRVATPSELSPVQKFIFDRIVREHCTYVEAYELAVQRLDANLPFGRFMKDVRSTFTLLEQRSGGVAHYFPGPPEPLSQPDPLPPEVTTLRDSASRLEAALEALPPDERLAIKLFIIEELPAASVAKVVGWRNSKAVYNRVYRSLERLRNKLSYLQTE